jgi:tetratricopeptide (TPR) repeat protein
MAVSYLRQAGQLVGPSCPEYRAGVLDLLADTLCRNRNHPAPAALREAIDFRREAAGIYQSLGRADDWARTQFNLGNSCCDLSELTGEDHWQEAVSHYRESLRVRTPEKDPERYAAVLENLGSACRRLAGGLEEHVRESIRCYLRALKLCAADSRSGKRAALQNNLGNAFLSLPGADPHTQIRNARRALLHFDRALHDQLSDRSSRAYGITQYNRAQAYFRLAQIPPADPETAIACLREAMTAFQACGEENYTHLVQAQLERVCRQ